MATTTAPDDDLPTIKDLTFGGQLTLWATRIWVQAHAGLPNLHNTLEMAFTLVRVPKAHLALDRMMTYFAVSTRVGRRFLPPRCPQIGPDEVLLLQLLAELQTGHAITAYGRLSAWLDAAVVPSAFEACLDYATLLQENRLRLQLVRSGPVRMMHARGSQEMAAETGMLH